MTIQGRFINLIVDLAFLDLDHPTDALKVHISQRSCQSRQKSWTVTKSDRTTINWRWAKRLCTHQNQNVVILIDSVF